MSIVEPLNVDACEPLPDETVQRRATHRRLPIRPYASLCDVRYVVDDGIAVLRGCVPSYYLKQLAQELVRNMDGVYAIRNELEVVRLGEPSSARRPK
jgi:osmotically-inducible protein OsmY